MDRPEGTASQAEGTARAKALRLECAWHVSGTARRLVWLERSGEAGGQVRGAPTCTSLSALAGPRSLF